jgi:hypothetical protein
MPDLSEFEALSQRKRRRLCQIATALDGLPADEADLLRAALMEDIRTITTGAIIKWLERRDRTVNVSAVTSHRRGTCACADATEAST